jgi:hypothetical protein
VVVEIDVEVLEVRPAIIAGVDPDELHGRTVTCDRWQDEVCAGRDRQMKIKGLSPPRRSGGGPTEGSTMGTSMDTGTEDLLAEVGDDGVAVITMNRPERRNAMSDQMVKALAACLPRSRSTTPSGALC